VESRSKLWTRRVVLGRVLARRCPQCGVGALFRAYGRLATSCAGCGLVYRREPGSQTGSMYLTAIGSELFAAGLILCLWWSFDWTPRTFVLVSAPLLLAFCVFVLPFSQALWVGVEYLTDLEGHEPWAELRPPSADA
jgi:uncharacterized protein (DUF983 family)